MKNRFSPSILFAASLFAAIFITSCVKHDIIEPPVGGEVVTNVVANWTIADLKAFHTPGGLDSIKEDRIIKAVVTADDRSGNFYKSLFIQDATGAVELMLNKGYLYSSYPVGREIYVKLNGLIVGDDGGLVQVGGYVFDYALGPVQPADVSRSILLGELNHPVAPKEITLTEAKSGTYFQQLVTLKNVEFITNDIGQYYADYIGKANTNRTMQDCAGKTITVRTSGYANFASAKTPGGNGTVTGILSAYNGVPQIFIRDLRDVNCEAARCDGSSGTPPIFFVDFTSQTKDVAVNLPGWLNFTPNAGGRTWTTKQYSNNNYAQLEAYNDTQANTEGWLVSPAFSASTAHILSFQSATAYWKHSGLEVMYSTNFNGSDPKTATWTTLPATYPTSGTANFTMVDSGPLTIPASSGNAWIAFKYTGTAAANTTRVQVDNIRLQ